MLSHVATFNCMSTALLRIPEVAEQLRVSRATVYRLIESGELAKVHIGRRKLTRVEQTALDAYIEKLRSAA